MAGSWSTVAGILGRGKKGGRERCTLRRFRIRGLIEGMLRTVMGNICSGHKAQVGRSAKGHEGNRLTSRPKEGNGVNEMQRGKRKRNREINAKECITG